MNVLRWLRSGRITTQITALVFMLLFYAGVAPDVMKKEGTQWEKPSWKTSPAASASPAHEGAHH